MLTVTILRTEDFSEELYSTVKSVLIDLIDNHGAKRIEAGGDEKDMIYRLFEELSYRYPNVFFTIHLSEDGLAYADSESHLFSLDFDIVYTDTTNAKQRRDNKLINRTDILICRSGSVYDAISERQIKVIRI